MVWDPKTRTTGDNTWALKQSRPDVKQAYKTSEGCGKISECPDVVNWNLDMEIDS